MITVFAGAAGTASAAPADDWSLEHRRDDPKLVSQRMEKLERSPFDQTQWRALVKALGLRTLASRIDSAHRARPKSIALAILAARAMAAQGKPAEAAAALARIQPSAGRHEQKVFDQRIRWLDAAGDRKEATSALQARAASRSGATRKSLLEQAYTIADRGDLHEEALTLARALAEGNATDTRAQLRLARSAMRAGEGAVADEAYARAIDHGPSRDRNELTAERAQARMSTDNPTGAAELLWSLLESGERGGRAVRAAWWDSLADAHRRAGTTDILVAKLGTWLGTHQKEAAAFRTLAQAQETAGFDPTEAWRTALRLSPRDVESHTALIEALNERGKIETALDEYRTLLSRHPSEVELGLLLAGRLIDSGDRELGLSLAADIEKRIARKPKSLLLMLDFYNLNDEGDLALDIAERVVSLRPRSPEARLALGEQLYQMNRTEEAVKQWATLAKMTRPAHRGQAKLAEVLSEHGRTTEAVTALKVALKAQPEEPSYIRLRAMLAEEQRRPGLALGLWEHVRALATGRDQKLLRDEARTRVVELLVGGSISKRRLRLDAAERAATDTLNAGDSLEDAIEAGRFLAELYTRQENYSAAVAIQQRLLELDSDDPTRLANLAAAQRRAGQVTSALGTLEELLTAEPTRSADTLAEMSELAFEAGDADRALAAASRAVTKDRSRVDALIHLGELHERRGDTDEARRAYTEAIEADARDVRARLRLAELSLTVGDTDKAAAAFREILDIGGPPELLRTAGERALDLAEVSKSTDELFGLAVRRTTSRPEADEPRQFLLEALERVDAKAVERWLRGGDRKGARQAKRIEHLRRPLVVALNRGSVGTRLRAASHLGWLDLPETAEPLAHLGASLRAPRDSTATVQAAFDRTRVTAIEAAGRLRDPAAIERFKEILLDSSQSAEARHAAAWALAGVGGEAAAETLGRFVELGYDPMLTSLGCLALAERPRAELSSTVAFALSVAARDNANATVRHACAFAEAVLTPDSRASRMQAALRSTDPVLAAVGAWRIGRLRTAGETGVQALLERYIGPAGLPRDAAGAAIASRLRADLVPIDPLPHPAHHSVWATTIERWLKTQIAPSFEPVAVERLRPWSHHVRAALDAAAKGTRAEREAAKRAHCTGPRSASTACLAPLTDGALSLPPRD